jgi:hypothetical protein
MTIRNNRSWGTFVGTPHQNPAQLRLILSNPLWAPTSLRVHFYNRVLDVGTHLDQESSGALTHGWNYLPR